MQVEGVESVGSPLEKKKKKKKKKRRDVDSGGDISVSGPASGAGLAPLGAPGRGLGKGLAPLPSIGDLQKQMNRRRQEAEEAFRRNQDSLTAQKNKEVELAKAAGVTEEDTVRRAEYLKAQRDKIIAKKKAEREAKAKAYSAENPSSEVRAAPEGLTLKNPHGFGGGEGAAEGKEEDEADAGGDGAEGRRNAMRIALARRMKQDLLINEEQRLQQIQEEQYSELDRQLRLVRLLAIFHFLGMDCWAFSPFPPFFRAFRL